MKILRLRPHFGTKAILDVSRKLAVDVREVHDRVETIQPCSNKVVREVLIAGLHGLDNSLMGCCLPREHFAGFWRLSVLFSA